MAPHRPLLHVAALPFPSYQGTQAALRSMLETEADAGWDSQLLTYAGAGYPYSPRFGLHRCLDLPKVRSLRSGPSFGKVLLDCQLVLQIRRLAARLEPRAIVAHHVEAMAAAILAGVGPVIFVAHTDLGAELPTYGPAPLGPALAWAGGFIDRGLLRRAELCAAVSPLLAERLAQLASVPVQPIPIPLFAAPRPLPSRGAARQWLGLPAAASVLLYAGNLDRYQGVNELLVMLADLRRRGYQVELLVVTSSAAGAFARSARQYGVAQWVHVRPLAGEEARAGAHAAADIAVVPRKAPGGLPVKLLDALARGVAVVASPTACAGLGLSEVCAVTETNHGAAFSAAVRALLSDPVRLRQHRRAGPCYLAQAHSSAAYLNGIKSLLASLRYNNRQDASVPRAVQGPALRK